MSKLFNQITKSFNECTNDLYTLYNNTEESLKVFDNCNGLNNPYLYTHTPYTQNNYTQNNYTQNNYIQNNYYTQPNTQPNNVEAKNNRHLEARNNRHLEARNNRHLEARNNRQLEAKNNRQLEAKNNRQLEAKNNRQLEAKNNNQRKLQGLNKRSDSAISKKTANRSLSVSKQHVNVNVNVKVNANSYLINKAYVNKLKEFVNKILSYNLVSDYKNNNKICNCSYCKFVIFHPIKVCNVCNTDICYKCFMASYSKLKTIDGKNMYNNDPSFDPCNNSKFNNAILCELKCKNKKCNSNSELINIYNDVNKKITKHELENKQFYKWKKLQEMSYFEQDSWRLDYNTLDINIQNIINKISKSIPDNIIKNYTFSINYKPDKDVFTIILNPVLSRMCNYNNNNTNNNDNSNRKIILQYPYNNDMFVNTAYDGLQQLMLYYIINGYNGSNGYNTDYDKPVNIDIESLINGYNNYTLEFMNILKDYKTSNNRCIDSYKCNDILKTLKNGYICKV